MISVDEKSTKNVRTKKVIKEKFSKKKENSDMRMFEIVDVENSNVEIFMRYHIDDTMTISNSFMKFFFKFKSFLKEESAAQTQAHKKEQEKKEFEKNENESFEKTKKKKTAE